MAIKYSKMVPQRETDRWADERLSDAHTAVTIQPNHYKLYHANIAASQCCFVGKQVLIVGCNRGEDCKIFVDLGAGSVTGLDVMDEIGMNYSHPLVAYEKASAERMPFDEKTFDFVFSYATMEHVPDIVSAFKEMGRVCARGGLIYAAAAPLWNSRQGPHWGEIFYAEPWLHLRKSVQEIQAYNSIREAQNFDAPKVSDAQILYWMDNRFFNKRWAREYLAACWSVPEVEVLKNEVECEAETVLPDNIFSELSAKGYSKRELLALTHIFTARRL